MFGPVSLELLEPPEQVIKLGVRHDRFVAVVVSDAGFAYFFIHFRPLLLNSVQISQPFLKNIDLAAVLPLSQVFIIPHLCHLIRAAV